MIHRQNRKCRRSSELSIFPHLLLDDWLPDGRGSELVFEMRRRGFSHPVFMISGARELERQRPAGADAVLLKPVDYDELCSLLKAAAEIGASR